LNASCATHCTLACCKTAKVNWWKAVERNHSFVPVKVKGLFSIVFRQFLFLSFATMRCALQHSATCCTLRSTHSACHAFECVMCNTLQHTAARCNTLQHVATLHRTHCECGAFGCIMTTHASTNTLQHTPTHSNTLPRCVAHTARVAHLDASCPHMHQ